MSRRAAQLLRSTCYRLQAASSNPLTCSTRREIYNSTIVRAPRAPRADGTTAAAAATETQLSPEEMQKRADFLRGAEMAQRWAMPWEAAAWGENKGPMPWYTVAYWTVFAGAVGSYGGYQVLLDTHSLKGSSTCNISWSLH